MAVADIVRPGDRAEIQVVQQLEFQNKDSQLAKVHKSQVLDVLDNGNIVMAIPLDGTQLVLMPLGVRLEIVFYSNTGLYKCIALIVERYKRDNVYMQEVELKTELEKFQRREFYRYNCLLDMSYYVMTEEEEKLESGGEIFIHIQETDGRERENTAKIVDISGGGLRFNTLLLETDRELKTNQKLLLWFRLKNEHMDKEYHIVGDVIACVRKNSQGESYYEGRVKFDIQDEKIREEIIRYIFEEERKLRQRESR